MSTKDTVYLKVYRLGFNDVVEYAEIKIKYGKIFWMNTNIVTKGPRLDAIEPGDSYLVNLKIEKAEKFLVEQYSNKISHRIFLGYPYNDEETYVYLSKKQLKEFSKYSENIKTQINTNIFNSFVKKAWVRISGIIVILLTVFGFLADYYSLFHKIPFDNKFKSKGQDSSQINQSKQFELKDIDSLNTINNFKK